VSRFLAAARSSSYRATSQKYASAIEDTSNPCPLPTSILDETALLSSSQLHHRTNEVAEAEAKKINAAYEFFTRKYGRSVQAHLRSPARVKIIAVLI